MSDRLRTEHRNVDPLYGLRILDFYSREVARHIDEAVIKSPARSIDELTDTLACPVLGVTGYGRWDRFDDSAEDRLVLWIEKYRDNGEAAYHRGGSDALVGEKYHAVARALGLILAGASLGDAIDSARVRWWQFCQAHNRDRGRSKAHQAEALESAFEWIESTIRMADGN